MRNAERLFEWLWKILLSVSAVHVLEQCKCQIRLKYVGRGLLVLWWRGCALVFSRLFFKYILSFLYVFSFILVEWLLEMFCSIHREVNVGAITI